MTKVLERLLGPLGPARDLPPGIVTQSHVFRRVRPDRPTTAQPVGWVFLGGIVAVNVVVSSPSS